MAYTRLAHMYCLRIVVFVVVTQLVLTFTAVFVWVPGSPPPSACGPAHTADSLLPLQVQVDVREGPHTARWGIGHRWQEAADGLGDLHLGWLRHLMEDALQPVGVGATVHLGKLPSPIIADTEPGIPLLAGARRAPGARRPQDTNWTWEVEACTFCDLTIRHLPPATEARGGDAVPDPRAVGAHQLVLAAESEALRRRFALARREGAARRRSLIQETNTNVRLTVAGISTRVLAGVLDYAYTGSVRLSPNDVLEAAVASRRLEMGRLHVLAAQYLAAQVDAHNAAALLVASEVLDIPDLQEVALAATLAHFESLWQSEAFLYMSPSMLWTVFISSELHASSEELVLVVVLHWLGHQGKCVENVDLATSVLGLVRWPALQPSTIQGLLHQSDADQWRLPGESKLSAYALDKCQFLIREKLQRLSQWTPSATAADLDPPAAAANDFPGAVPEGIYERLWSQERNWGFDVEAAQRRAVLKGHTSNIVALIGSRSGYLLSASQDGTVRAWDPVTGHNNHTLEGLSPFMSSLVVVPHFQDPAEDRLAIGSADGTITLCGMQPWVCHPPWEPAPGGDVRALAVVTVQLSRGRLVQVLVSGGPRSTLKLWDIRSGARVGELGSATMSVGVLASADGVLVSGETSGTIRVWSTEAMAAADTLAHAVAHWRELVVLPKAHLENVRALALYNGRLLSGSDDGNVTVWNHRWERELSVRHGDAECSKGRSAGKAKESGRSISMAYHGTIPHRMLGVNGQIQGATVSVPDHQRRLHSLEMTSTSSLDDTAVAALSAEDVAEANAEFEVIVEEALKRSRAAKRRYGGSAHHNTSPPSREEPRADGVNSVAWVLGRGGGFTSGGDDGTIRIWDTSTGKCMRMFEDHKHDDTGGAVRAMHHVKAYLAAGGTDETIKIYQ